MSQENIPKERYVLPENFYYEERSSYRRDEPRDRIARLTTADRTHYSDSLYKTVQDLNSCVAGPNTQFERLRSPIGELIIRRIQDDGSYDLIGLDYLKFVQRDLFPYGAHLAGEIDGSDIAEDEKLLRLANLNGTMIAESQSFSFGNKRTARAFYGRIRFGLKNMAVAQNACIDFSPPKELEHTLLLQSLARATGDIYDDLPQMPHGGLWVDPKVADSLLSAKEVVNSARHNWGKSSIKYLNDAAYNRVMFNDALKEKIPDDELRQHVIVILGQEDYGPAAYSLISDVLAGKSDILTTINTESARKLIEANNLLLKMRIKSLMAGLACGGRYAVIENATEFTKERTVSEIHWQPSYVE